MVSWLRHWDKDFYWLIDWDIETLGTGVFGGWLVETLGHVLLSFSGWGPAAFVTGTASCHCGEKDEVCDEREAMVGCFITSIAGWLMDVKRRGVWRLSLLWGETQEKERGSFVRA
jgi:hypothetical protein